MKKKTTDWLFIFSLNPCFNGRCTSTNENGSYKLDTTKVLILVLMEDALVRSTCKKWPTKRVLILVLMEDALVQFNKYF